MMTLKQKLESDLKDLTVAYETKRMTLNEYMDTVYQISESYRRKL